MLLLLGGFLPTIRVNSRDEGRVRLSLRHLECYRDVYGRSYGEGYDVWEYTFYTRNLFDYEMVYSAGRIVLDFDKKTMVEQTLYDGSWRNFQAIASLFFIDAVMYTGLPTLKSIALKAVKTHIHSTRDIRSLD